MRFIISIFTATSLLATVVSTKNGFITPVDGQQVKAGEPCLISWKADTPGPVEGTLNRGDSKNLDTVDRVVMLEFNWGNYTPGMFSQPPLLVV